MKKYLKLTATGLILAIHLQAVNGMEEENNLDDLHLDYSTRENALFDLRAENNMVGSNISENLQRIQFAGAGL
jgi:hypothetical protein